MSRCLDVSAAPLGGRSQKHSETFSRTSVPLQPRSSSVVAVRLPTSSQVRGTGGNGPQPVGNRDIVACPCQGSCIGQALNSFPFPNGPSVRGSRRDIAGGRTRTGRVQRAEPPQWPDTRSQSSVLSVCQILDTPSTSRTQVSSSVCRTSRAVPSPVVGGSTPRPRVDRYGIDKESAGRWIDSHLQQA